MFDVLWSPPRKPGRPSIFGTVLSDGRDEVCLVRRVFSGGANAGNTGSPRVDVWVGLRQRDMGPLLLRRTGDSPWEPVARSDIGIGVPVEVVLSRLGFQLADVWPGSGSDWPATLWDRRVVLPDDRRWPPGKRRDSLALAIVAMLRRRNDCPDDEVWRIDAQILGLSHREGQSAEADDTASADA